MQVREEQVLPVMPSLSLCNLAGRNLSQATTRRYDSSFARRAQVIRAFCSPPQRKLSWFPIFSVCLRSSGFANLFWQHIGKRPSVHRESAACGGTDRLAWRCPKVVAYRRWYVARDQPQPSGQLSLIAECFSVRNRRHYRSGNHRAGSFICAIL